MIGEIDPLPVDKIEKIVLCSGKIYFDVIEERRERNIDNVAVIRIEQLYPFPQESLVAELARFPHAREICWTQEEPQNMGAWYSIQHAIRLCMKPDQYLVYAGRSAMSAPAGGDFHKHQERQRAVVNEALHVGTSEKRKTMARQPQLVAEFKPQSQLGDNI